MTCLEEVTTKAHTFAVVTTVMTPAFMTTEESAKAVTFTTLIAKAVMTTTKAFVRAMAMSTFTVEFLNFSVVESFVTFAAENLFMGSSAATAEQVACQVTQAMVSTQTMVTTKTFTSKAFVTTTKAMMTAQSMTQSMMTKTFTSKAFVTAKAMMTTAQSMMTQTFTAKAFMTESVVTKFFYTMMAPAAVMAATQSAMFTFFRGVFTAMSVVFMTSMCCF